MSRRSRERLDGVTRMVMDRLTPRGRARRATLAWLAEDRVFTARTWKRRGGCGHCPYVDGRA